MPDTMIRPMYVGLDVQKETTAVANQPAYLSEPSSVGCVAPPARSCNATFELPHIRY